MTRLFFFFFFTENVLSGRLERSQFAPCLTSLEQKSIISDIKEISSVTVAVLMYSIGSSKIRSGLLMRRISEHSQTDAP